MIGTLESKIVDVPAVKWFFENLPLDQQSYSAYHHLLTLNSFSIFYELRDSQEMINQPELKL